MHRMFRLFCVSICFSVSACDRTDMYDMVRGETIQAINETTYRLYIVYTYDTVQSSKTEKRSVDPGQRVTLLENYCPLRTVMSMYPTAFMFRVKARVIDERRRTTRFESYIREPGNSRVYQFFDADQLQVYEDVS